MRQPAYELTMETTSGTKYTGNGGVMGWVHGKNELTFNGVTILRVSEVVNPEMLQQMLENLNFCEETPNPSEPSATMVDIAAALEEESAAA